MSTSTPNGRREPGRRSLALNDDITPLTSLGSRETCHR